MVNNNKLPRLSQSPLSLKILITCFLVTLALGYAVALLRVFDQTHFNLEQIRIHYRGDEGGEEMGLRLAPSFTSLLSVAHVHSLSQPLMLALLGLIFVFTHWSEKTKATFIFLAFLGSVLSNAAPWMIRYAGAGWLFLLPLSQIVLMTGFCTMILVSLHNLWLYKQ